MRRDIYFLFDVLQYLTMDYNNKSYEELLEVIEKIFQQNIVALNEVALPLDELQDSNIAGGEIFSFLSLAASAYSLFQAIDKFAEDYMLLLQSKDVSLGLVERMEILAQKSQNLSLKIGESVPKESFPKLSKENSKKINLLYATLRDNLELMSELNDITFALNIFRHDSTQGTSDTPRILQTRGHFTVFEDNNIKFKENYLQLPPYQQKLLLLLLATQKGQWLTRGRILDEINASGDGDIDPEDVSTYISNLRRGLSKKGVLGTEATIECNNQRPEASWRIS